MLNFSPKSSGNEGFASVVLRGRAICHQIALLMVDLGNVLFTLIPHFVLRGSVGLTMKFARVCSDFAWLHRRGDRVWRCGQCGDRSGDAGAQICREPALRSRSRCCGSGGSGHRLCACLRDLDAGRDHARSGSRPFRCCTARIARRAVDGTPRRARWPRAAAPAAPGLGANALAMAHGNDATASIAAPARLHGDLGRDAQGGARRRRSARRRRHRAHEDGAGADRRAGRILAGDRRRAARHRQADGANRTARARPPISTSTRRPSSGSIGRPRR